MFATAADSFSARKFSARVSIAVVTAVRISFSSFPTAGFSSLGSDFIFRSIR